MWSAVSPLSFTALTSAPLAISSDIASIVLCSGPRFRPVLEAAIISAVVWLRSRQIRIGTLVEQHADERRVADLRRSHQRRGAFAQLRIAAVVLPHEQRRLERDVRVGAAFEKQLHDVAAAAAVPMASAADD